MKYALFVILILSFLLYPYTMSTETWGLMPKSQEDNETIEGAINRLIAEHEADPEAHTGANESLAAHRANEVLDHPQQSVVADKQLFSLYDEIGQVNDGYGWDVATGNITGEGARNFYGSLWNQTEILCYAGMPWFNLASYPDAPLLYRFFLDINNGASSDGYVHLSYNDENDDTAANRIEFIKDGTNYYFRIYASDVKVSEYVLQTGGNFSGYIALYFNKDEESIDLFVDGSLVHSYSTASWHDFIFSYWTIHMLRTTNTSISMTISSWGTRYTAF